MADDFLRRNAGRLLREQWRNPVALAQELYVMMSDRQAAAHGSASAVSPEVQARAVPAARALPAIPPSPADPAEPRTIEEALKRGGRSPGTAFTPATASAPGMPGAIDVPALSQPDPIAPADKKPFTMAPPFPDWDWNLGVPGVAGTSTFIGIVVGGSGSTPSVTLYPAGSTGAPGNTVTVKILQLASGELIPGGTWIAGIQQYTDAEGNVFYEGQLPIWLG